MLESTTIKGSGDFASSSSIQSDAQSFASVRNRSIYFTPSNLENHTAATLTFAIMSVKKSGHRTNMNTFLQARKVFAVRKLITGPCAGKPLTMKPTTMNKRNTLANQLSQLS